MLSVYMCHANVPNVKGAMPRGRVRVHGDARALDPVVRRMKRIYL